MLTIVAVFTYTELETALQCLLPRAILLGQGKLSGLHKWFYSEINRELGTAFLIDIILDHRFNPCFSISSRIFIYFCYKSSNTDQTAIYPRNYLAPEIKRSKKNMILKRNLTWFIFAS